MTLIILCVLNNLENPESCVSVTTELHSILSTLRARDITQPIKKKVSSVTGDYIKHETSRMFPEWSIPSGAGKKRHFQNSFIALQWKKERQNTMALFFLNVMVSGTPYIIHLYSHAFSFTANFTAYMHQNNGWDNNFFPPHNIFQFTITCRIIYVVI